MGIHTLYRLIVFLAALTLCISVVSCGRGHRRSTSTSVPDTQNNSVADNNTPAENTQPVFKPFPIMPEGDYSKSKVRQVSALEFSVTGADKVASIGYANRIDENDSNNYVVVSDAENEIAYAQYNVEKLTEYRPVKIDFEMQSYKSTKENDWLPLHYYIGICNFTKAIWEWNGPYTEKDPLKFTLSLNSQEQRDRYVDKIGTLHFAVITSIKGAPKLSKLGRVGVGFKSSTTTISPNYNTNNPHYIQIKNIYAGKKFISSLSSINLNETPLKSLSSTLITNPLDKIRTNSAITEDQYITLEWDHVTAFNEADKVNEAAQYNIYRKGSRDADYLLIVTKAAPSTSYKDPTDNLTQTPSIPEPVPGEQYSYYITANNSVGYTTPKSSEKSIIQQIQPPTNVKATFGYFDKVTVSWDQVAGAVEYEVWASDISKDINMQKLSTIPAPSSTSTPVTYYDSTAELNKLRYYHVRAIGLDKTKKEGVSLYSEEVCGCKGLFLQPPTDVHATDGVDETKITITWKAPTKGTIPEGYSIWRSTIETGEYSKIGDVTGVLKFDDTTVPTKDTYWFKVKSTRVDVADSDFSFEADRGIKSNIIMPPINVIATDGSYSDKVRITWEPPVNSPIKPDWYAVSRIKKPTIGDPEYTIVAKGVHATQYDDTTMPDCAEYYYVVQSYALDYGYSGYSAEDKGYSGSIIMPPFNLKASDNKYLDKIEVTWNAPSSAPVPDGYYIYRSLKPDSDFIQVAFIWHPATVFFDLNVPDFSNYYYKAVSYKATYSNSTDSNTDSGCLAQLQPPSNVKASDGTFKDKITISWEHPTLGLTPDGYKIYRSSKNDYFYSFYADVGYVSQWDDNYVPEKFYTYIILSYKNGCLDSLFSYIDHGAIKTRDDWTSNGREATHNRRSPFIGSVTNTLKWKFSTSFYSEPLVIELSSPAIGADGTVFIGNDHYDLYAINHDGSYKWIFQTSDRIRSSPAIGADGTVYVGSYDHYLYAVNPDGTEKWKFKMGSSIGSSPVISADGTVFVGCYDNNLYAVNPDGTEKWKFKTLNWVASSPAIGVDNTIYVCCYDSYLYAINPDGTEKWKFKTGGAIHDSSPALSVNGTIFVGSSDYLLYAINLDGTEKWKFKTGGEIYSSPAIGADGTVYVGSNDHNLYAVNTNGTEKWKFKTGSDIFSSPAIGADGTVYVGSDDDYLFAINLDGSEKWKYYGYNGFRSSPAIGADGTVYVGSRDGYLYAIGPGDGKNDLNPPVNVAASDGTDASKIVVSWDAPVSGPVPDGYYIYHALSDKGVWQYIGMTSAKSFDDTYADSGKTYYYKVQSYKYAAGYNDSPDSTIDTGTRK